MQNVLAQVLRRLDDVERRLRRTIRIGKVAAVQQQPYRVAVDFGDGAVSGWLHVVVSRAGSSMLDFSPLDIGEGVLVLAPGGGDVMFALPSIARGRIELIAQDPDTRYILGDVRVAGDVGVIEAAGAGGNVTAAQDVTAAGQVTAGPVALTTHVHPIPGGTTGAPQ